MDCIVTGASAGIGTATAVGLASRGHSVALVGRDRTRLDAVAEQCRSAGAPVVRTYACDFASLAAVRELAASLLLDWPRLHLLVNNAGLVLRTREQSEDGYEKVFAVNHLAPYLLTRLLTERLVDSAPARVVNVASDAHRFGALDPDDYMSTRRYQPMRVYGRSKLANVLFTVELARRLDGTGVTANCVHPGFVSSSLGRDSRVGSLAVRLLSPLPFVKSPTDGAATTLHVALDPVRENGEYFAGHRVGKAKAYARDPVMAARLWADSAELVGLPVG